MSDEAKPHWHDHEPGYVGTHLHAEAHRKVHEAEPRRWYGNERHEANAVYGSWDSKGDST